jgi:hypothetical protein
LGRTGFSASESEDAFRLLELTARCCGMVGIMCGVKQDLNERRYGSRIDRALVTTTIAIQFTRRRVIETRRNETRKPAARSIVTDAQLAMGQCQSPLGLNHFVQR